METIKAPSRLVKLANELASAKAVEAEAKDLRIDLEQSIIGLLDFDKDEGQETYSGLTSGGSTCRVVVKQPINTTFDGGQWPTLRRSLSESARKAVVSSYKLDTKEARIVQDKDPESWAKISDLVSRKPGKVSIEIKSVAIQPEDNLDNTSGEFPGEVP